MGSGEGESGGWGWGRGSSGVIAALRPETKSQGFYLLASTYLQINWLI